FLTLHSGTARCTGTACEVLEKGSKGDLRPPRERNAAVPRPLEAVCQKAMALRPEDRYASPRELANDLEHWLADEPVSAWPEPWGTRLRRWGRRHRPLVAGASALLLSAVAALGVGLVVVEREREQTARERDEKNQA